MGFFGLVREDQRFDQANASLVRQWFLAILAKEV